MKHVTWEIKRSRARALATARWIDPEGEISFLKGIDVITNTHFEFYCMDTLLPLKGGRTIGCIKRLRWVQGRERWSQEGARVFCSNVLVTGRPSMRSGLAWRVWKEKWREKQESRKSVSGGTCFGLSLLHAQAAKTSEEARDSKLGFYFLLKE